MTRSVDRNTLVQLSVGRPICAIATKRPRGNCHGRVCFSSLGGLAYLLFLGTFLYAIAFVGNLAGPKTIDSGEAGPVVPALIINTLLLGLFAIQHSVMARPAFKRWWTRFVPHAVERTTYVLLASLVLLLLYWQWRPMPDLVWSVTNPGRRRGPAGRVLARLGVVLISTFLINHFELFGLRQVYARLRGETLPAPVFKTPLLLQAASGIRSISASCSPSGRRRP